MSSIDNHIQLMVNETVKKVSIAMYSELGVKLKQLEGNDRKMMHVFSQLNQKLAENQETILSLRRELKTVNEKLRHSRTTNETLGESNDRLVVSNDRLTESNDRLIEQNTRLKKRGRTYMKYEDKLHIIIQHVVHWEGDHFYIRCDDVANIFEHSSKPNFDFKRTLTKHGYTVKKIQWKEIIHYSCCHNTLTKQDIEMQICLYKKKRRLDDDDDDDIWKEYIGKNPSENSLFDPSDSLFDMNEEETE